MSPVSTRVTLSPRTWIGVGMCGRMCPPPLMSAPSLGKQNPRSRGWGATPSLSLPSSPERQPLPASIRSSTRPSTHQQLTHRGPSGNTEMTHVCSWNQAGVTLSLRTRPLTMHGSLFHRRCSRAPCGAKGPPLSTFGLFHLASSVCGLFTRLQTRAGVCALRLTRFRPLPDAPAAGSSLRRPFPRLGFTASSRSAMRTLFSRTPLSISPVLVLQRGSRPLTRGLAEDR